MTIIKKIYYILTIIFILNLFQFVNCESADDDCTIEREKCIDICTNGSKSPACYRNCTKLYNECKEK